MLLEKDYATYWAEVEAEDSSKEFKDLFLKLVAYNPEERPDLEKLKSHAWMTKVSAQSDHDLKVYIAQ